MNAGSRQGSGTNQTLQRHPGRQLADHHRPRGEPAVGAHGESDIVEARILIPSRATGGEISGEVAPSSTMEISQIHLVPVVEVGMLCAGYYREEPSGAGEVR